MGPTHYSFSYGNSLFVLLNTEEQGAAQRISDEQAEWARAEMAASKAENIFVFLHRPLFSYEGDPAQKEEKWEAQWSNMADLFSGFPVRAVFSGHWHGYRDCGTIGGVHYVICAGASVYGNGRAGGRRRIQSLSPGAGAGLRGELVGHQAPTPSCRKTL